MLFSFLWGLLSFFLVYWMGPKVFPPFGAQRAIGWVAPVVEESVKVVFLLYLVTRRDFTYLGDGAVYGFACGVAFSILENYLYLASGSSVSALYLGIGRSLSTSLIHGSATSLAGLVLAYFKWKRIPRLAGLFVGLGCAVTLHAFYNQVVWTDGSYLQGLSISSAGLAAVIGFSTIGLLRERQWIRAVLKEEGAVSISEARAVNQIHNLGPIRAKLALSFGRKKAREVEALLLATARLGLKKKAREKSSNQEERAAMEGEIQTLRQAINKKRRAIGPYCMLYVRAAFPGKSDLWTSLESGLKEKVSSDSKTDLWEGVKGRRVPDLRAQGVE